MNNFNLDLRGKLLVIVLIGFVIGFSIVASFRIHRDKIKIAEEISHSGNERVSLIAESVANLLVASDRHNLESLAERFVKLEDVEQINILDNNGAVLVSRNSINFNPKIEGSVFEAPIVSSGNTIGSVQMFVSLDRLHEAVSDIYKVVAIALSFTIIFFGMVIYAAVSILIVRPLVRLGKAADRLALGDYAAELPPVTRDELGNLVHAFSLMRESRRLSEAKLLSVMNAAETANTAKSIFLSNMSHEIRTPMNSIIGMANLALKTHLNAKQHDYLSKIDYAAHHLLELINNILDLSKIEANKLELEALDFELHTVFENLSNQLLHIAASKGLLLNFVPDSCLTMQLRGDPLRLTQVLLNYTSNAIKFTDKGEITIRARILDENAAGMLIRFEVQDTGIGIGANEIDKLFQAFHQADASTTRKYGGTGLGLAICKQLVEMMDGQVGIESQPNFGSTFWFTARLAKGNAQVVHAQPLPLNLELLKGASILLVEDNLFNQQVLLEMLRDVGANVSIASNGQEAIDMLQNRAFDCVLMDIQMPVMDGLEATRKIRNNPALADIYIIAMTANAGREDRARCFDAGMDNFVSKPVFPEQLFAVIAQCLVTANSGNAVAESLMHSLGPVSVLHANGTEFAPPKNSDPAGEPELPPVDLSKLRKVLGSDPATVHKFALKFLQSAGQGMDEIEAALEQGSMVALATLGHRNKSPARTVGAHAFADLCQALEQFKSGGDIEDARKIVDQMRPMLARISDQINKEMT